MLVSGNKASILLSIKISGDEMRTDLSWNADFDISGIISGLGQGIVKKVSEEKISEIINNVKNVLEAPYESGLFGRIVIS